MAISRTGRAPHQIHDIGPAAGYGGVDNGRLAVLEVRTPADLRESSQGSGPVEIRHETPEEHTARLLTEAFAVKPQRPASRPAPIAIPAIGPTARHAAQVLESAVSRNPSEPAEAPVVRQAAQEKPVSEPIHPSIQIPCTTCLHEPVCALKSSIPTSAGEPFAVTTGYPEGLRMFVTAFTIQCDHFLGELRAPEPVRVEREGESWRTPRTADEMQTSRLRGGEANRMRIDAEKREPGRHPGKPAEEREKAARAAQVMAALDRNGGDRKAAAAELGMRPNALAMVVKFADRRAPAGAAS